MLLGWSENGRAVRHVGESNGGSYAVRLNARLLCCRTRFTSRVQALGAAPAPLRAKHGTRIAPLFLLLQDGVMHKEEFMLALFKSRKNSLFGERVGCGGGWGGPVCVGGVTRVMIGVGWW